MAGLLIATARWGGPTVSSPVRLGDIALGIWGRWQRWNYWSKVDAAKTVIVSITDLSDYFVLCEIELGNCGHASINSFICKAFRN